jgi:hypothetical protein
MTVDNYVRRVMAILNAIVEEVDKDLAKEVPVRVHLILGVSIRKVDFHFLFTAGLLEELRSINQTLRNDGNFAGILFTVAFGIAGVLCYERHISDELDAALYLAARSPDALFDAACRDIAIGNVVQSAANRIKRVHDLMNKVRHQRQIEYLVLLFVGQFRSPGFEGDFVVFELPVDQAERAHEAKQWVDSERVS